jgi:hypothetical protein
MLERLRAEQKRLNMRDFTGAELRIRTASRDDLSSLVEILNYYITHSNVTFQTNETTVEDRLGWFEDFGKGPYQILVAEREGTVIGCAYSSRYRAGPAFDTTVETSIYLAQERRSIRCCFSAWAKIPFIWLSQVWHCPMTLP